MADEDAAKKKEKPMTFASKSINLCYCFIKVEI